MTDERRPNALERVLRLRGANTPEKADDLAEAWQEFERKREEMRERVEKATGGAEAVSIYFWKQAVVGDMEAALHFVRVQAFKQDLHQVIIEKMPGMNNLRVTVNCFMDEPPAKEES